jgi:predicted transcriptional regulator
MTTNTAAVSLTSQIVSSYVASNNVNADDLQGLIHTVYSALLQPAGTGPAKALPEQPTPTAIRKSITRELLISFEDGKGYKTLKRHLTLQGLTPQTYRAKWGLPADYPMISPAYAEKRSQLAKSVGLGSKAHRAKSMQKSPKTGKAA